MPPSLQAKLTTLKGVGPKTAEALASLGLHTCHDMLFHLPLRYEDRTCIVPLASVRVGQHVLVEAQIVKTWQVFHKRRSLLCQLSDGQRKITLRFFHFHAGQKNQLMQIGMQLRCFGEVRLTRMGLEMVHPEYELIDEGYCPPLTDRLTPVYPTTDGLGQKTIKKIMQQVLAILRQCDVPDFVDAFDHINMCSLKEALLLVHEPPAKGALSYQERVQQAHERLAFGELLAYQLRLGQLRDQIKLQRGFAFDARVLRERFLQTLPFSLTSAQARVLTEIDADIASGKPMLRLLQGDVGSGKTAIALLALLSAFDNGFQSVFMAPTEILANQHLQAAIAHLEPLGLHVGFLSGSLGAKARKEALQKISDHDYDVIVGTHALFQDGVDYAKLGLVVVDEQHRFGVHQRLALAMKNRTPGYLLHQLVMSATPIPRTLAMTAYADLDYSVIDELPPGRKAITTTLLAQGGRKALLRRVAAFCAKGHQAYWVCTLIDASEELTVQAATDVLQELQAALVNLNVALVHGRMKADEKQAVMDRFIGGDIDVLVATTVIEVGVNVPNASLMVVDGAERLGLAQLHQLRGRVGRGSEQSFCMLLHASRLSDEASLRMQLMEKSQDGFYLAEQDMKMRGAGEILGKRQAGLMMFRIADIERDQLLIEKAKILAKEVRLRPDLVQMLLSRWQFDQRQELLTG